jgi:hypothetical protein
MHCLLLHWVKSAVLITGWSLPIFPNKQTIQCLTGCLKRANFRSPLTHGYASFEFKLL